MESADCVGVGLSREIVAAMEPVEPEEPTVEVPAMAASARSYEELVELGNTLSALLLSRERQATSEEHQAALQAERLAVEARLRQVDPDAGSEVDELLAEWDVRIREELDTRTEPS